MESWKAVNRDNLGEHHTFKADDYGDAKTWVGENLNPRVDWCVYNITPEEELINF